MVLEVASFVIAYLTPFSVLRIVGAARTGDGITSEADPTIPAAPAAVVPTLARKDRLESVPKASEVPDKARRRRAPNFIMVYLRRT